MLTMVQDVFGKHTEMYDEFKLILNARGATDSVQNDLWYSMPLSEIDFSQVYPSSPPSLFPSLNARGFTDSVQNDLWYSMPLSEIDF